MFPTLPHLIYYLTGIRVLLPVQTFGFFMALAFWFSYLAFKKEFYRKEMLGYIQPFLRKEREGKRSLLYFTLFATAGFVIGYKAVYCIQHYRQFATTPGAYVFTWNGSIIGGLLTALVTFAWLYYQHRSAPEATKGERWIHPYEVTDRMLLWCAVIGFIGALLLPKLEHLDELTKDPVHFLARYDGMAFYGGLIFGAGIYLYRCKKMGIPFLTAADIGSPGMLLAYTIGRMGCHLSGDGDWGIVNTTPKPSWLNWAPDWAWSFDFPHNIIHQGKYIPGCADAYCTVLTEPVFPTSLYESVIIFLFFAVLWLLRNRFKRPGLMFFVFLLGNGIERFFMEFIKINKQYCIANICLSQAQYIALSFILAGIAGLVWLNITKPAAIPGRSGSIDTDS